MMRSVFNATTATMMSTGRYCRVGNSGVFGGGGGGGGGRRPRGGGGRRRRRHRLRRRRRRRRRQARTAQRTH